MGIGNWEPLVQGDIVEIVAPGMSTSKTVLKNAVAFLNQWGLVGRYPKDIFGSDTLCANRFEKRLQHMKNAVSAKDSKAIWCMRGGYGSFHLLDGLDKAFPKGPSRSKAFLGLSDGTSLHHFFQQSWGWSTLHASNIDRYAAGVAPKKEMALMKRLLLGDVSHVEYGLKPINRKAQALGSLRSSAQGGNLITCQATIGTRHQMETTGRVLFFEDIGERGYRVDRCLKHFEAAGLFKGVRGFVFGDFTGGREPNGPSRVPRVLQDFAQVQKVPVFTGLPTGHGKLQMPVPMGTTLTLSGGAQKGLLRCQSGARL